MLIAVDAALLVVGAVVGSLVVVAFEGGSLVVVAFDGGSLVGEWNGRYPGREGRSK